MPDPEPKPGQILVRPLFTGICGSDLSLRKQMAAAAEEAGIDALPVIVPGHEFTAEIVDVPRGVETHLKRGALITSLPFSHDHEGPKTVGISPDYSGGLATLSCVDAMRSFAVEDGVAPDLAALTEPLAVGLHASRLASRNKGPNLVIGCGPVGLAVILSLKLDGRGPILAADFSSERRAVAEAIGADVVIDPARDSAFEHWGELGFAPHPMSPLLAREFRGLPPGANIFECTGVTGLIGQVVGSAMPHSHVVVAGVCPHEEKITPLDAILRELT
ncbi:MAG: zinc-binding dehydrogenase, partial [Henriciella sp.]